ncbi:MAG TPA: DEAD/DEAH box helicase, partial [Roseiflexaceae bacterium]|nr:DEAD/DEAH box helicase [Roseiflexaceae bacterium]
MPGVPSSRSTLKASVPAGILKKKLFDWLRAIVPLLTMIMPRSRVTPNQTASLGLCYNNRYRVTWESSAVPEISEIIQAIARQRGRGDAGPLVLLRQLDGATGERISHLPIDGALAQAWVALRSEPFRPHQAQALTALRRGEPVALAAASADVTLSAYLLLYATLLADPQSAALLLAPDVAAAHAARDDLTELNQALPQSLRLTPTLIAADRRPDHYARIVVATPEALHYRLLRHHDRAWNLFWQRLRLVALPEAQRYAGVAGAHMANLLLRMQRIASAYAGDQALGVVATIAPCDAPEDALNALLGQTWRVIAADDGAYDGSWLAVWRGASRLREAADLANQIRRQGFHVHIACEPLE